MANHLTRRQFLWQAGLIGNPAHGGEHVLELY